jgi:hypothetical protein
MKRDAPITSELFLLWLSGPAEGDDAKQDVPLHVQIWHHVFARYVGHIIDQLKLPLEWILVSQLQTYGYQLILRLAREIHTYRYHPLPALIESQLQVEDDWYQTTYSKYKKTSSTREQLVVPSANDLEIVLNAIRVADTFVRSAPDWGLLTFSDPMMTRLFDAIRDQYYSALLHRSLTIDHQTMSLSSLLDTQVTSNHRAWLTQITNYIHDEMPVIDHLTTKECYLNHFEPEESEEDNDDNGKDDDEEEDDDDDDGQEDEEEEEEEEAPKKSKY